MSSCAGCRCLRKPRYRRLVDALYPQDPGNADPVTQDLEKLLYLVRSEPHRLDDVGEYLAFKLRRSLVRDRRGHVCVSVKIMEKLLSEVHAEHLRLLAESFLNMVHELLSSNHHFFQNLAANSFVSFAALKEDNPPYHRQYDFCIERFAAMSLLKKDNDRPTAHLESRLAGLRALRGVVHKVGEGTNLNLWDSVHLNKIIPAYLINMQDYNTSRGLEETSETYNVLMETAETGLKELLTVASISHANAVLHLVLEHLDSHHVWLSQEQFATDTFVFIIKTMQPQARYLAIKSLLSHLDSKSGNDKETKIAILKVLSSCVSIAADESIGPSMLDVFRTLVKHMGNSIEKSQHPEQDKDLHEIIVKTVGEFVSVLPDYHNPDIMNLICSYLPREGDGNLKSFKNSDDKQAELITLLVKCLCLISESDQPSSLETALPESLLISLSQLMELEKEDTQLDVIMLWQKMIDRHRNGDKIPYNTDWTSLGSFNLVLGNAPIRFRQQANKILMPKLLHLSGGLSMVTENVHGFYKLLLLIVMEFLSSGMNDVLILSNELEDLALTMADITPTHRNLLHSFVAGSLHVVSLISDNEELVTHLEDVLKRRQLAYPHLLPEKALKDVGIPVRFNVNDEEKEQSEPDASDDNPPYFRLMEKGFIHKLTEPRHSTTLNYDKGHSFHRSYSIDQAEDQESNEAITFNHLKGETLEREESVKFPNEAAPSFNEMVGLIANNSTIQDEIADILKSASPRSTVTRPVAYDRMPSFI